MESIVDAPNLESLQKSARDFAVMIGESVPELVVTTGFSNINRAIVKGQIACNAFILERLNPEETRFYVAYMYAAMRKARSDRQRPGGVFNIFETWKRTKSDRRPSDWLVISLVAAVSVVALVLTSPPLPGVPNPYVFGLVVIAVTVAVIPMLFRMIWGTMRRIFDQAVRLTGDRRIGESFAMIYITFYMTGHGRKPVTEALKRKIDRATARWIGESTPPTLARNQSNPA